MKCRGKLWKFVEMSVDCLFSKEFSRRTAANATSYRPLVKAPHWSLEARRFRCGAILPQKNDFLASGQESTKVPLGPPPPPKFLRNNYKLAKFYWKAACISWNFAQFFFSSLYSTWNFHNFPYLGEPKYQSTAGMPLTAGQPGSLYKRSQIWYRDLPWLWKRLILMQIDHGFFNFRPALRWPGGLTGLTKCLYKLVQWLYK